MSSGDQAQHLAELEVRRNRTLADLETVQTAVKSVQRSMEAHAARQDEINQSFIARLESADLSEAERQQIYREWNEAFKESIARYNRLAEEREHLHVQELILVRMLTELDYRIRTLKEQML